MKHIFSLDHSSPARLAGLTILGVLLSVGGFLGLVFLRKPPCLPPLAAGLSLLVCAAAGMLLSLRAQSRLKDGIENGEWTDEQLAPLRDKAQWPLWTPLSILFILASTWCIFSASHILRHLVWPFLLPVQAISQLRQALIPRRRLRPGPGASILHSQLAPIHSDHWGER